MNAQELRDALAALVARYDAELLPAETLVGAGENLQLAIDTAQPGATIRLADGAEFVGNFVLPKPVTLVGTATLVSPGGAPALTISGSQVSVFGLTIRSAVGASTNDLIVIRGVGVTLAGVYVYGNGATKRGVAANGTDMMVDNCSITGIGRVGQESQAVAIWDGTGLTIRNSYLQAGSTPFLAGGAAPTIPNMVPADILLEGCTLTHDMALRGQGYVCKTGFELKSGKRVVVRNCTIENVWVEGQTAYAITLTPSQAGSTLSPETTVEDVLVEHCLIRNCGGGLNGLGFTQQAQPTQRGHYWRFLNNTFVINRSMFGGHGSLMQLGIEPADILWDGNYVTADGDAFIRTTDTKPIDGLAFTNNKVNKAGTYGIWTPAWSRGGPLVATAFPNLVMTGNTFTGAHSIFKTQFLAGNTWQ